MNYFIIIVVSAFIVSLFFESVRDFLGEHLGDLWDDLSNLPSQLWETFSTLFTNLNEFSGAGMAFGLFAVGIMYLFRSNVFKTFEAFPLGERMLWTVILWVGAFASGYLVGKRVFEI